MNWLGRMVWRLFLALFGLLAVAIALASVWQNEERPNPVAVVERSAPVAGPSETPLWGVFYPSWKTSTLNRLSPLVSDPFKRTDSEARVSESLRPRVIFWMAIYGVFPSHTKVMHDRLRPDLIYGHIDLSVFSQHMNAVQYDQLSRRVEISIRRKLSDWLLHLADGKESPAPFEETQLFRTFLVSKGFDSAPRWRELAEGLRSQSGQQDAFLKALARSESSLPEIEKVFREHGLPRHAARIPFVESSFNFQATSKVGAMGVWQFTPTTAKEWIGGKNKARWRDPKEQAVAAARMLRSFRKRLPDWGTSITAYNSGVNRLARLVQKYRAHNLEGILDRDAEQNGLGFAGENFYAEVLAANLVESYKTEVFTPQLLEGMLAFSEDSSNFAINSCLYDPNFRPEDLREPASRDNLNAGTQGDQFVRWMQARWTGLNGRIARISRERSSSRD